MYDSDDYKYFYENRWPVTGTAMRVNKTHAVILDFDNHGKTEEEAKQIYENLCKRVLPDKNSKDQLEKALSECLYAEHTANYGIHIMLTALVKPKSEGGLWRICD